MFFIASSLAKYQKFGTGHPLGIQPRFTANTFNIKSVRNATFATILTLAAISLGDIAHAQFGSYRGNRYSTGTTSSAIYTSFDNQSNNTTVSSYNVKNGATTTAITTTLVSNEYFGFNISGASTTGAGTREPSPVNPYPAGYEFAGALVEKGTGAGGAVAITMTGASIGTTQAFHTNTFIKGATESGGMWNVRTGQASFLGGYTDSTHTGTVTLDLGGNYTSWGTLIGTNPGANLDVSIVGYSGTTEIFRYTVLDIVSSPANPTFTGFNSNKSFNQVVITGLSSSTGGQTSPYTGYPNAAFIALDQVQAGFQAVPEPGTAALLVPVGLACLGFIRRTRKGK